MLAVVEVSWVWLEMRTWMGWGVGRQEVRAGNGLSCFWDASCRQAVLRDFFFFFFFFFKVWGFPSAQLVKNLSASAGDPGSIPGWGRSPGGGQGKPTPVFLSGESHGQRSLVGLQSMGSLRVQDDSVTFTSFHFSRGSQV